MARQDFQEDTVVFHYPSVDIPCFTYYKIFGDLRNGQIPVVVLHGGPGSGHDYMLPFSQLWTRYNIPVVFYDQIGCANSTHFRHKANNNSFWQIDLFLAELKNLLQHLQLDRSDGPGYHIFGHSWGGILAIQHAATQPSALCRLVLAGTPASMNTFFKGMWELKKQLPLEASQGIDEAVRSGDYQSPAYLSALETVTRTFFCRANPWPPEFEKRNQHQMEDPTVRSSLVGKSPWQPTGSMLDHNSTPVLDRINVPALVYNGEFDTAQDASVVPLFDNIPRVRWVTLTGASHMGHLDSPELQQKIINLVGNFLTPEKITHRTE